MASKSNLLHDNDFRLKSLQLSFERGPYSQTAVVAMVRWTPRPHRRIQFKCGGASGSATALNAYSRS